MLMVLIDIHASSAPAAHPTDGRTHQRLPEEAAGAPSGGSFTLDELFALRTALRSKESCLPRERLPGELDALEGEVAVAPAEARRGDAVSGARAAGGWPPRESPLDEARRRLMA